MTNGAVFTIIANDGNQDKIITASSILRRRLRQVENARRAYNYDETTPTLLDVTKTHAFYLHSKFKPFVALAYEYAKVQSQSGTTAYNSEITFSIPQFGDFFADCHLHATLGAPTISRTDDTTAADSTANTLVAGRQHAPSFRWCTFPGERLIQEAKFTVNGNELDKYSYHVYNFYREFCVLPHKRDGWYRNVGQEIPNKGFLRQPGVDGTATAVATTGVVGAGGNPIGHRFAMDVAIGAQTPKLTPAAIEVFVPLLFWFNLEFCRAVPSVAIPYGQRFVTLTLAATSKMYGLVPRGAGTWSSPRGSFSAESTLSTVELYVNNIFTLPIVHDIFVKRIGFTLVRVYREQTSPITATTASVHMSGMKWPIETMFVGLRIKSYETSANQLDLDKWHSFSTHTVTAYAMNQVLGSETIDEMEWSALAVGVKDGTTNMSTVTLTGGDATTKLAPGDVVSIMGHIATVAEVDSATSFIINPGVTVAITGTAGDETICRVGKPQVEAAVRTRTIDTMTVKAHGVNLYNNFPGQFYNATVPLTFGGTNIQTPEDPGCCQVQFNLYPGSSAPSGHINVSRAREFYIDLTCATISSSNEGTLVVVARTLNFLLITDGSAVMRYST